MALVQDRCICLRKTEYSETSQVLLVLGRQNGLVRMIAKGAHRVTKAGASKFGGGIDLLDVAEAVFIDNNQRDLATLTEWGLRDGHRELRSSLRGLYLAFYAAEMVGLLIEERDPHPTLFDRLESTLPQLAGPRAEQAFLAFELELLSQAGYLPELGRCIHCGGALVASAAVAFVASEGGLACGKCLENFPQRRQFNPRLINVLQQVIKASAAGAPPQRLPVLTRHQTDPINAMLVEHIQHTLSRRLRLASFVL